MMEKAEKLPLPGGTDKHCGRRIQFQKANEIWNFVATEMLCIYLIKHL